ncbi:MAG: hypothetical protein LBQ48_04360, partial [Oscillospiraceae bacterium]|nr:hypothetical protein [Oscillospiraceae bacterium]
LKYSGIPGKEKFGIDSQTLSPENILQDELTSFCDLLDKPLVVFFDEADCLSGQTLISFLRQLRDGYVTRSDIPFIHSLALVGMRNIRDYRDEYRDSSKTLGTASPFNIIKTSMTLRNFTRAEITELYAQHTEEIGQVFEPEAEDLVWEQTQGQPWLVNAIADASVMRSDPEDQDAVPVQTTSPVTREIVSGAIRQIIAQRGTHFDSLMARIKEERIKNVLQPIILGDVGEIKRNSDDYSYVKDMGLIRDDRGLVEISNPIYAEVIVRALNGDLQANLTETKTPYEMPKYYKNDAIDVDYLLSDFQVFWRENSAIWQDKFAYREAAPHLILMAFLQRVINGGGFLDREFAAETRRADLCIRYRGKRYPIEIKLRYSEKAVEDGKVQLAGYMKSLGAQKGWLVVFDRREDVEWGQKLYMRHANADGLDISVFGC